MYDDFNFEEQKKRPKKLEYQLPDRSSRKNDETSRDTTTAVETTTVKNVRKDSSAEDKKDDGLIYIQYQEANQERWEYPYFSTIFSVPVQF